DHRERRHLDRMEDRRVEAEVGSDVRQTGREHPGGEQQPLAWPEDWLVRQVDNELRPREPFLQRLEQRHADVVRAAQLLRPAGEPRTDDLVWQLGERVPHDRRVVLPVHDGQRAPHDRVVTSDSIRPVYFSYASVSVENWMI